jgi:hypothetical protein
MVDTKTSDETPATLLTGAEQARIVQGGSTKRTTLGEMGHQFRGARARMTADDTAINATSVFELTFDEAAFDTDTFWSAGAPKRLTIPAGLGITHVIASGSVFCTSGTNDTYVFAYVQHYNSANVLQKVYGFRGVEMGTNSWGVNVQSGPIAVSDGDYFTLAILQETDTSITIEGDHAFETHLAIQVIGMEPV